MDNRIEELDRRIAEYWTRGLKNILQKNSRILDKRIEENWTEEQENIGQGD
jgi:hypothetical protein